MKLPRPVLLLIAARGVNQLGAFSLAFLTVLLCRDFGASLGTAGAVSAAFGIATIPSRLAGGYLAGRLGRRRTILLGLFGCAVAQLGIATAPSLGAAAGFTLLLGLAFELYEPPSQAIIADAVPSASRTQAYALLTTALSAGGMGAGLIADLVGQTNLRRLFLVDAASCVACALILLVVLPRQHSTQKSDSMHTCTQASKAAPWQDRALLAMTASGTVFALIYMLMVVALPLSLADRGLNPASAGLLMTVSTLTLVAVRPVMGRSRLAQLSAPKAFGIGYALLGAGLVGYAVGHSLSAMVPAAVLWSLGNLLLMGQGLSVVTELAPGGESPSSSDRYLAVYGLSWGVATVAAPLLGTQVIQRFGPGTLWIASAAVCAGMAVGQPRLVRAVVTSWSRQPSTV